MHFDGGVKGHAKFFGAIADGHTVPLSVLIPMTGPAKLMVCNPLTQALRRNAFHGMSAEERQKIVSAETEILTVNVGEMLVFTHDFCHCGAKDVPNSRMFLSFSHPSSLIAQNQVVVI